MGLLANPFSRATELQSTTPHTFAQIHLQIVKFQIRLLPQL